jgi:hypothetical protein
MSLISAVETDLSMQVTEIITVLRKKYTAYANALCWLNVELHNVKLLYSYNNRLSRVMTDSIYKDFTA